MNEEYQKLYEQYNYEIYLLILKLVSNRKDLAEELTQETLYQIFLSLHRYRGECEIRTWIYQVAKNTCFKYFKKNPIHISIDEEEFEENRVMHIIENPEDCFVQQEKMDILNRCIHMLKPKYKDVLVYRLYFELHFKQIGQILHISENSAKVIYHRGKEMLIKEMEELYHGK